MRSSSGVGLSVERFFQFSLLGLVTSGYLAVAGSGFLDMPTIVLTAAGLCLRALSVAGLLRLTIPDRIATLATLGYIGFFPIDYAFVSQGFLQATVHLVFFLAVLKILTASNNRDYAYLATIAFLELLAAAILSVSLNFFVFLALYLFFAMAAFTSSEILRSMQKPRLVARCVTRRFHSRLAALTAFVALGILSLTAGLFFMLPRTAHAALERLVSRRIYLPGFSNQVSLGQIGEVKNTSSPVMHIGFSSAKVPADLKWRGSALATFDGKRWFNSANEDKIIPIPSGSAVLGNNWSRKGIWLSYQVDLNGIDTDALFFAGAPEVIRIRDARLIRTSTDSYRLMHIPSSRFRYSATSFLGDGATGGNGPTGVDLSAEQKRRYLQLPTLDTRIAVLAQAVAGDQTSDLTRARAIERHLRTQYGYTLELLSREVGDPLAHFLFERRKGHCEYFASAMTVMLRTAGIPARLVNGFQSGIWNPISELYVIRASDAHSWVEAYLPGRGWTIFDPTPPDPNPRSISFLTKLALYADAAETFWQEWVLNYDLSRQATLAERVHRGGSFFGARWFDLFNTTGTRWNVAAKNWLRRYGFWLLVALSLAAIAVKTGPAAWQRFRVRRRAKQLRRGQASTADATLMYARMLQILGRHGYFKPAWFTPHEFAAVLPAELRGTVAQFTQAYNALRFGSQTQAAPQLSALLDQLERRER